MLAGQRLQPDRYAIIPRALAFLVFGDEILLLKLPHKAGAWAGRYNGVGGHIEQGEDPQSSAIREIREETGIIPSNLALCGVITVDTGNNPGIGLYIFVGFMEERKNPRESAAGVAEWKKLGDLDQLPLVPDLTTLIPKALSAFETKKAFSAQYRYDQNGELTMKFNGED